MAAKKQKKTPDPTPAAQAPRDLARTVLRTAIGKRKLWLVLDGIDGDDALTIALAIAAPAALVPRIRASASFTSALGEIRGALVTALPVVPLTITLVPIAYEPPPESLAYALEVSDDDDLARALALPPPIAVDPSDQDGDLRAMRASLRNIEAAALRRLEIGSGRALRVPSEVLLRVPDDAPDDAPGEPPAAPSEDVATSDGWLPACALQDRASGAFWLIARLGSVVSIRSGKQMRSLKEKRTTHPDRDRAAADFAKRVAAQRAAGYVEMVRSEELPTALLHHEPAIAELERPIVRRAARELLALETWSSTLAAQAVVRALQASGGAPLDAVLAAQLVARIAATSTG